MIIKKVFIYFKIFEKVKKILKKYLIYINNNNNLIYISNIKS